MSGFSFSKLKQAKPSMRRRLFLYMGALAALLLVCILLGGMAYFTVSVLHLITQLAVNSACDLMQLKINAAVTAAAAQVLPQLLRRTTQVRRS